jgi:hypothetical protein
LSGDLTVENHEQTQKSRFHIERLEERIAPSGLAVLGPKAHHDTVVVTSDGSGDASAILGAKAHHNTVIVIGGSDCNCGCPMPKGGC